jgi:ADP-ribose diphosphatase
VPKSPIIHSRRQVARSKLFRIEELDITFSNGVEVQYERLVPEGHGAVIVVPFQDPETVLMIREYAAGSERYELVLPKGKVEAGEHPEQAANREMAEEISFTAETLTHLTDLSIAPGYMRHATHLVLAEGLSPAQAEGDEPEPLEVVPWRLDQLLELGLGDDCTEARSLAALYIARDYMLKEALNKSQLF